MLIAVSGNVGSGKTTLARYLSEHYDLCFVPRNRLEFGFLDTFFQDIEGTFLPTQLSFLISKAVELQQLLREGKNIVVDRSLLEDSEVFARLWIENRSIDERIVKLYRYTADFIRRALPEPDLYLFCRCPAAVSRQRISSRPPRSFEAEYPPNHIEMLERYYEDLFPTPDAPCVEIDTELCDFTASETLNSLCTLIFEQFETGAHFGQLSFFEENEAGKNGSRGLTFHHFDLARRQRLPSLREQAAEYIYLAAPFTQMAAPKPGSPQNRRRAENLFSGLQDQASYGRLDASYQNKLKRIEQAIVKSCQMEVHLPHRDINDWGKTQYPTEYLTPRLIRTVERAAAVVAIPGSSIGVHLELGIAIARRIPIVIFHTGEFSNSFFVEGFTELPFVKYMRIPSLAQIPARIAQEDIAGFIAEVRTGRRLQGAL